MKHRKRVDHRREQRRTLLIVALLVLALAVTDVAYAEFTKSYRAKRVIASYQVEGMLFASNYLKEGSEIAPATIYIDQSALEGAEEAFDVYVSVHNYAHGNPQKTYGRVIHYRLDAELVELQATSGGAIVVPAGGTPLPAVKINDTLISTTSTYNGTLDPHDGAPGDTARTDEYKLSLPKTMAEGRKYYVRLTATPTDGYTDIRPISQLFDLALRADTAALTWHIEATDDRSHAVGEYSGYNFQLSGSGSGTVTLGWNDTKLTLSKVFRDAVGATPAVSVPAAWGANISAVTFAVNAANINSYDIQFYEASTGSVADWSDAACDATVFMTFAEDE